MRKILAIGAAGVAAFVLLGHAAWAG